MRNQTPKKRILLRGAAAALALCMVLGFTACGKKKAPAAIRVDLSGRVYTLDPQYCSTALERCLLKNCMEGLLRRLPDGTMAEGCAENYSVSADGLRYTFTLRENLQWSDGEPLKARDFVFAFQRIQQGSGSAAAREQFAAIAGMAEGESGSLGAAAPDDRTVIITLSRTDPLLPEKLAEPEAFPCREDFYTGTHARYGNTLENMIYNGPYTVKSWESAGLRLIPNSRYTGLTPAQNTGVIITLGKDNTMERFLEGLTDCCRVDSNTLGQLSGGKTSLLTFRNGTVSLLLNQASPQLAQEAMRQAKQKPQLFGMLKFGRLVSGENGLFTVVYPKAMGAAYVKMLSIPEKNEEVAGYLTQAAGYPCTFRAAIEGTVQESDKAILSAQEEARKQAENSLNKVFDMFGRENVRVKDE